jgi:hypothetical protein
MVHALDERAKKIADGLAAAEKGKTELEAAHKRVDQELAQARNDGQQRIADAEKRALTVADDDADTDGGQTLDVGDESLHDHSFVKDFLELDLKNETESTSRDPPLS